MTKVIFILLAAATGLPSGCGHFSSCVISLSACQPGCDHRCAERQRSAATEPRYAASLQLTAEKERFIYRRGENLRFGVSVTDDSYVECFLRRANGAILKVFPNRSQRSGKLSAGTRAMFPDPVFFPIKAGDNGVRETLLCMAAARAFRGAVNNDFETLSFSELSDVVTHYRSLNESELVVQTLLIEVRP